LKPAVYTRQLAGSIGMAADTATTQCCMQNCASRLRAECGNVCSVETDHTGGSMETRIRLSMSEGVADARLSRAPERVDAGD
jgi:2-methylaconitate cis-trans-isomerase PrpF